MDFTDELQSGDAYMIKDKTGSQIFVGYTYSSPSLSTGASTITVVDSIDTVNNVNNYKVAIYKMKAALVPVDSSSSEMKQALENMNAMGTVDVTRFGPTIENGYTWSITYTSAYGTTHTCTGLDSDSDCLAVSDESSLTYTIQVARLNIPSSTVIMYLTHMKMAVRYITVLWTPMVLWAPSS